MPIQLAKIAAAAALIASLGGCGFRPLYATPEGESASFNQRIAIGQVIASEAVQPNLTAALQERMALEDDAAPDYELIVSTRERAERLAVQIDATVTRYNYRLRADYMLVDLNNGRRYPGKAQAVTSYNIVSSQYSTLFAERTAQKKAARMLAEEIERDLLLRFAENEFDPTKELRLILEPPAKDNADELLIDPDTEDNGDVPDPFVER